MDSRPEQDQAQLARRLMVAESLRIDVVTREVVEAFQQAGIRLVLLKGAAFAHRLYRRDIASRPYQDTDVLVRNDQLAFAEHLLGRRGFEKLLDESDVVSLEPLHAYTFWRQRDRALVDLHRTLFGARGSASEIWRVLWPETEHFRLGTVSVPIFNDNATALHAALHAAQHGIGEARPLQDLDQALEIFSYEVWEGAARLADQIDAVEAFVVALRMSARGTAVLAHLDLRAQASWQTLLWASSPPPVAQGLSRLIEMPGLTRKTTFVARKVVPSRRFIEAWSGSTHRSRWKLAFAYLCRPVWLLVSLPEAIRAVWRVSKVAKSAQGRPSKPK